MNQAAAVQTGAAVQAQPTSLRKLLGMGQGQIGDGFAMIFQQMLGDGDEEQLSALLMQMAGSLQEDSEELGGQMSAEMLAVMAGMNLPASDLMSLMQQDGAVAENVMEVLSTTMNSPQGRTQLPALLSQLEGLTQQQGEGEEIIELPQADKDFVELLSAAWKETPEDAAKPPVPLTLDHSTVRAIKEQMEQNRKGNQTETLDIESLQADVNTRRFLPAEAMTQKQSLPVPDAQEIAKQLKTGILDNLAKGKNEFLVRLKPEGLGEILVKLSETKDKVSLSIFTNDSQTARLISGEVAALQNALRPLNAEVQEITTVSANEQASQYSAQNQMTDQGRQFFDQQPSHEGHSSHRGGFAGSEDTFDDTVEAGLVTDEALDTYI